MEHHQPQRPTFWKSPCGIVATLVAAATSVYESRNSDGSRRG